MKRSIALSLGLLIGCSVSLQDGTLTDTSEVVSMSPLPPLASSFPAGVLKLNVLFRVLNDGSVAEVNMLVPTGDPVWDASAIDSMRQWRFTADPHDTLATDRWIRMAVLVRVEESIVMNLGELIAAGRQEADSLHSLLVGGIDFLTLAKQVRVGSSNTIGRSLGAIDIARYPRHVRDELRKLRVNGMTEPIRLGGNFVIYKRFALDRPR